MDSSAFLYLRQLLNIKTDSMLSRVICMLSVIINLWVHWSAILCYINHNVHIVCCCWNSYWLHCLSTEEAKGKKSRFAADHSCSKCHLFHTFPHWKPFSIKAQQRPCDLLNVHSDLCVCLHFLENTPHK